MTEMKMKVRVADDEGKPDNGDDFDLVQVIYGPKGKLGGTVHMRYVRDHISEDLAGTELTEGEALAYAFRDGVEWATKREVEYGLTLIEQELGADLLAKKALTRLHMATQRREADTLRAIFNWELDNDTQETIPWQLVHDKEVAVAELHRAEALCVVFDQLYNI